MTRDVPMTCGIPHISLSAVALVIITVMSQPRNAFRVADPYSHHEMPVLKMLKRQVRNFRTGGGQEASITLVFHTKETVDTHWFLAETRQGTRIMYPILPGHPNYRLKELRSGHVTALTLLIQPKVHRRRVVLNTVLTLRHRLLQYHLETRLDGPVQYRLENVESPEWLAAPDPEITLAAGDQFSHHCRVFLRGAKGGNSLALMHAPPVTPEADQFRPTFTSLVLTHDRGMERVDEDTSGLMLSGRLEPLSRYTSVLDVSAEETPGRAERRGFYMCSVERDSEPGRTLDRVYLLTHQLVAPDRSLTALVPARPRVELLGCTSNNEELNGRLVVTPGTLSCVRCRGFGHPLPQVNVTLEGLDLSQKLPGSVVDTRFLNVAEGGMIEAIYVFRNVRRIATERSYDCVASNIHGESSKTFTISLKQTRQG